MSSLLSDSSIDITTNVPCPMNCRLCPQDALKKNYSGPRFLPLEDFENVADKIPRKVVIRFSGFSEPCLNPDFLSMIEYASENHRVDLYSTLIGLKEEDVPRLAKVDINYFALHIQDNLGNAHIPVNQSYKDTLIAVMKSMRIDGFSVMNENFPNQERADNLGFKRHKRGFFSCNALRNNAWVMLPNCDVVVCCQDFGLKHCLGNLLGEGYFEVLNGEALKAVKRNRFRLGGDILCRRCKWASNPLFYSLVDFDIAVRRFMLRHYFGNVKIRDQVIREHMGRVR